LEKRGRGRVLSKRRDKREKRKLSEKERDTSKPHFPHGEKRVYTRTSAHNKKKGILGGGKTEENLNKGGKVKQAENVSVGNAGLHFMSEGAPPREKRKNTGPI